MIIFICRLTEHNSIIITKYRGTAKDVVIPATINDKPVTIIGDNAFSWKRLTRVIIPDSVKVIEDWAFVGNNLTSVEIPHSVTAIGFGAFRGNQLTNITIPHSVTTIEEEAFNENQLTSVIIPNSVTSIEDMAFSNNQLTSVEIPNSVKIIEGNAFSNNKLKTITLGANVQLSTNNKYSSFDDNFDILYNSNGKQAGTYKLINNKWEKQISETDFNWALINNSEFKTIITITGYKGTARDIVIPSTIDNKPVTTIGIYAFAKAIITSENNRLTSVEIPNSVITIEYGAFAGNHLTSINIPHSITTIRAYAFAANYLNTITLGADVQLDIYSFDDNFDILYNSNGKQAGTYKLADDNHQWELLK